MRDHKQIREWAERCARGLRIVSFLFCPPAIAIAFSLIANATVAAQDTVKLDPLGGPGGNYFEQICKPGRVLVGVQGWGGVWIDSVQAVCARFDTNGVSDVQPEGRVFGGAGGERPLSGKCPNGTVVGSIEVSGTNDSSFVGFISLNCLNSSRNSVGGDMMRGTGRNSEDLGFHGFHGEQRCPPGTVAVGILGRAGKFVQVGYVYRFVPAFRFLHDLLANRAQPLGRLVLALLRLGGRGSHSVWKHRSSSGGGAINEVLVHLLDLAGWLFGPIDHALWHQKLLLRSERVIDGTRVSADAEDFVLVTTQGRGGIHIVLQADLLTPAFQQTLEVNGEAGSFLGSIEPQHPSFIHLLETRGEFAAGRRSLSFPQENLFHSQMRNFVENILRGTLVDCATVADSLQLLKIVEQARAN